MKNKTSITIGIPVYNEELSIGLLLRDIIKQSAENFRLEKIIVLSDGSNDKTCDVVRSVNTNKIKLIEFPTRLGKSERINNIIDMCKSNILILCDGDIRIKD